MLRLAILILDDSTSAGDVATETKIQTALEGIINDRTSPIYQEIYDSQLGNGASHG